MKLHEATKMFMMVDYIREMTSKRSCKHGEYGLFEHLTLFFLKTILKTENSCNLTSWFKYMPACMSKYVCMSE